MSYIFDGREFAGKIEEMLLAKQKNANKQLKIVTFLDENNKSSVAYSKLKEKMANRLGIIFIKETQLSIEKIKELNNDNSVNGIMVQLPYPGSQEAIAAIDPKKDIDGLLPNSSFQPAVVVAVKKILEFSGFKKGKLLAIGAQGTVGSHMVAALGAHGMDKNDFDLQTLKDADVVVSSTGQHGMIKPEMVKQGVIAIDVGYPKGDFEPEVADVAAFFTPVPGGVGPVTVVSLFENLILGSSKD